MEPLSQFGHSLLELLANDQRPRFREFREKYYQAFDRYEEICCVFWNTFVQYDAHKQGLFEAALVDGKHQQFSPVRYRFAATIAGDKLPPGVIGRFDSVGNMELWIGPHARRVIRELRPGEHAHSILQDDTLWSVLHAPVVEFDIEREETGLRPTRPVTFHVYLILAHAGRRVVMPITFTDGLTIGNQSHLFIDRSNGDTFPIGAIDGRWTGPDSVIAFRGATGTVHHDRFLRVRASATVVLRLDRADRIRWEQNGCCYAVFNALREGCSSLPISFSRPELQQLMSLFIRFSNTLFFHWIESQDVRSRFDDPAYVQSPQRRPAPELLHHQPDNQDDVLEMYADACQSMFESMNSRRRPMGYHVGDQIVPIVVELGLFRVTGSDQIALTSSYDGSLMFSPDYYTGLSRVFLNKMLKIHRLNPSQNSWWGVVEFKGRDEHTPLVIDDSAPVRYALRFYWREHPELCSETLYTFLVTKDNLVHQRGCVSYRSDTRNASLAFIGPIPGNPGVELSAFQSADCFYRLDELTLIPDEYLYQPFEVLYRFLNGIIMYLHERHVTQFLRIVNRTQVYRSRAEAIRDAYRSSEADLLQPVGHRTTAGAKAAHRKSVVAKCKDK